MDKYLIKAESDTNDNKFYLMQMKDGEASFNITYGRVGTEGRCTKFPKRMWNIKLQEKLNEGYKDVTHLIGTAEFDGNEFTGKGANIINELLLWANKMIESNYSVKVGEVNQKMIDSAYDKLSLMSSIDDIDDFNDELTELFSIVPRKMNYIKNFLAKNDDDIEKILQREYDLLNTMSAFVSQDKDHIKGNDVFEKLGLRIEEASKEDIAIVKSKLNHISGSISRVWKVENVKTQKAFNKYIEDNHIENTDLLWHGSGNVNWYSILTTGLRIRPKGVKYTGSMFGDGLYFATKASKSFNYTSYKGSYWAGGTEDKAFMALYDVALGNPYNVFEHNYEVSTMDYTKLRSKGNYDCLFAHAGKSLLNDEIIFYRTDQVTVKYLVEFI